MSEQLATLSLALKNAKRLGHQLTVDGHLIKTSKLDEGLLDQNSKKACLFVSTSTTDGEIEKVPAGEMYFEFTGKEIESAEYDWQRSSWLIITEEDREHLLSIINMIN